MPTPSTHPCFCFIIQFHNFCGLISFYETNLRHTTAKISVKLPRPWIVVRSKVVRRGDDCWLRSVAITGRCCPSPLLTAISFGRRRNVVDAAAVSSPGQRATGKQTHRRPLFSWWSGAICNLLTVDAASDQRLDGETAELFPMHISALQQPRRRPSEIADRLAGR